MKIERERVECMNRRKRKSNESKKISLSLSLSKTEIDDTKNKLKCNLVSMNFVGSSVWMRSRDIVCVCVCVWDGIPGKNKRMH